MMLESKGAAEGYMVARLSRAVNTAEGNIPREVIIEHAKSRIAEDILKELVASKYLQFQVSPDTQDDGVYIITGRILLAPPSARPQPAPAFTPRTVRLLGLEWMAEPLTGYGGTEIDGRTYYTQDEAIAAAEQIGHGWRLPTKEEHEALAALGSTWVEEGPQGKPGRWFGGNHDSDHEGSVFYEASGYRSCDFGGLIYVGAYGYAWSSSPTSATSVYGSYLTFNSSNVYPEGNSNRANGFPVRLVREANASNP